MLRPVVPGQRQVDVRVDIAGGRDVKGFSARRSRRWRPSFKEPSFDQSHGNTGWMWNTLAGPVTGRVRAEGLPLAGLAPAMTTLSAVTLCTCQGVPGTACPAASR